MQKYKPPHRPKPICKWLRGICGQKNYGSEDAPDTYHRTGYAIFEIDKALNLARVEGNYGILTRSPAEVFGDELTDNPGELDDKYRYQNGGTGKCLIVHALEAGDYRAAHWLLLKALATGEKFSQEKFARVKKIVIEKKRILDSEGVVLPANLDLIVTNETKLKANPPKVYQLVELTRLNNLLTAHKADLTQDDKELEKTVKQVAANTGKKANRLSGGERAKVTALGVGVLVLMGGILRYGLGAIPVPASDVAFSIGTAAFTNATLITIGAVIGGLVLAAIAGAIYRKRLLNTRGVKVPKGMKEQSDALADLEQAICHDQVALTVKRVEANIAAAGYFVKPGELNILVTTAPDRRGDNFSLADVARAKNYGAQLEKKINPRGDAKGLIAVGYNYKMKGDIRTAGDEAVARGELTHQDPATKAKLKPTGGS